MATELRFLLVVEEMVGEEMEVAMERREEEKGQGLL